VIRFHDEIEPRAGVRLPEPRHVRAILRFGAHLAAASRRQRSVWAVINCHMGVSRSTAAAAIVLLQRDGIDRPDRVFAAVLDLRPQAWPNLRMIRLADDHLRARGRIVAAVGRVYARQLAARPEIADYMRAGGRGEEVDLGYESGAKPNRVYKVRRSLAKASPEKRSR